MKVGSLFSGYGGLDMAVGGDLAWYAEVEPAACKVMAAHHPGVPNLGDVTRVDWSQVERVDVITAGYPCQPFSNAGNRKGKDDERHLWPYVRDAIGALGPSHVVLENVRGHLTLGFADVLADLADLGMSARWGVVRASDAGACHSRARLFVAANPVGRQLTRLADRWELSESSERCAGITDPEGIGWRTGTRFAADPSGPERSGVGDRCRLTTDSPSDERPGAQSDDLPARGTSEPEERAGSVADTSRERHGSRQGPAGVGRVGSETEGGRWEAGTARQEPGAGSAARWGEYAPAIDRWERVLVRSAPAPTVRRADRDRLSPLFVEWMMGLPEGWVTGHGLSASQELKMLGNGVVPQQAALALRLLGAA